MESGSFYIKYKSRVSGPFSVDYLHAALRRGSLTRAHLISSDGNTWTSVGNHSEFIAKPQSRGSPAATIPVAEAESTHDDPQAAPATPSVTSDADQDEEVTWRCRGCGVPLVALLSALGQLVECPDCGRPNVVQRQPPAAVRTESVTDFRRKAGQRLVEEANLGVGLAAGVIGLLAMHVPLLGDGDQYYFWWDTLKNGASTLAVAWIMLLLSAVALCILSPLTKGLARGIIFVALPAIWLLLSSVAADTVLFLWLAPLAVLTGGVSWASHRPGSFGPRLTLCISGASASLASLILLILFLIEMDDDSQIVTSAEGMLAFIGVIVGLAAGTTAGILGITSIRPKFHRGINEALRYTTLAAVVFPSAAVLLALVSAEALEIWGFRWEGWFLLAALRVFLFFAIIYVLISRGILEIGLSAPVAAAFADQSQK